MFLMPLSACTKGLRPTPDTTAKVIQHDISQNELLDLYRRRLQGRNTLKALIEVRVNLGKRGKHRFQSEWRSEGNRIRMRGFNLFGGTLFQFELRESRFSISLPKDSKVFQGDVELFDDMVGEKIPFGSRGLLEWISRGGIPEVSPEDIFALEKRDEVLILYISSKVLGQGVLKEKIWIERTAFLVEKVEFFDPTGLRKGVLILGDYQKPDDGYFPFSMTGESDGQTLELSFKELSFPIKPFASGKNLSGRRLK